MDINTLLKREPDLVCYYNFKSLITREDLTEVFKSNVKLLATTDSSSFIGGYLSTNINYYVNDKNELVGRLATKILSFPFGSIVCEDSRLDLVKVNVGEEPNSQFKPNSVVVSRITSGNKDFVNSTGFVVIFTDETDIRKIGVFFDKK